MRLSLALDASLYQAPAASNVGDSQGLNLWTHRTYAYLPPSPEYESGKRGAEPSLGSGEAITCTARSSDGSITRGMDGREMTALKKRNDDKGSAGSEIGVVNSCNRVIAGIDEAGATERHGGASETANGGGGDASSDGDPSASDINNGMQEDHGEGARDAPYCTPSPDGMKMVTVRVSSNMLQGDTG